MQPKEIDVADEETGEGKVTSPQDARLDSLEERLAAAQKREAERTGSTVKAPDENERLGYRVFSLLIGGLLGGSLIGWVLDRIFQTGGLLLIAGLVLGIAGGFWSIFKLVGAKR